MKRFAVRPEINGAKEGDYEKLHHEMYVRQFYRVIQAADPEMPLKWYDLPSGIYDAQKNLDLEQVYIQAIAAVQAVANSHKPNKGYELILYEYSVAKMSLKLNTDINKLPPGATPNK